MNNPEFIDSIEATDKEKLILLSDVFRIASFNGGEREGGALSANGEISCRLFVDFSYEGQGLYDSSERVHVADIVTGRERYDFFAILDKEMLQSYVYDSFSLSEALYELSLVTQANKSRYPADQSIEDVIGFDVSFATQRIEVYKNLPLSEEYELASGQSEYDLFLKKVVEAIDKGDVEGVNLLVANAPTDHEVDIEQLKGLEIMSSQQVDGKTIRELHKILSQAYLL